MQRARLVVLEVGPRRRRVEHVGQQVERHQHVGLLEQLGVLAVEVVVARRVAGHVVLVPLGDGHVEAVEVARELLDQLVRPLRWQRDRGGDGPPPVHLRVGEAQRGRDLRVLGAQLVVHVGRRLQVPTHEVVGERVVVDVRVELIGTHHPTQRARARLRPLHPVGPEAAGLEQDLRAPFAEERPVAGGLDVLHHPARDVGVDVHLLFARPEPVGPSGVNSGTPPGRCRPTPTGSAPPPSR